MRGRGPTPIRAIRQEPHRVVVGPFILAGMFLIMFALKLAGPLADLSWWWVTAPLWAPPALLLGLAVLFSALALAEETIRGRRRAETRKALSRR